MSVFHTPVIVLCSLESMWASFFWSADLDERWMHKVSGTKLWIINRLEVLEYELCSLLIERWCLDGDGDFFITIFGSDEGLSSLSPHGSYSGPWNNLIRMIANLQDGGLTSLPYVRLGSKMVLLQVFGMIIGFLINILQWFFIEYSPWILIERRLSDIIFS